MKRLLLTFAFLLAGYAGNTGFFINPHVYAVVSPEPELTNYLNALSAASVTPTSPQQTYISNYITSGKTHGWFQTRKGIYFPVWNNTTADAINLRNPGTYDLGFVGSPSGSSNGIAWDGTDDCANTGITPSQMAQNSIAISYYSQTNVATLNLAEIGGFGASTGVVLGCIGATSATRVRFAANNADNSVNTFVTVTTTKLFTVSRLASNLTTAYRAGASLTTSNLGSSTPEATQTIYLGARNNNGTRAAFTTRKMSYADIGDGLTAAQEALHNTDVQQLHTDFSIAQ